MSPCVICAEPLKKAEQQTCHDCLLESASLLSGVLLMWAELPAHRGQLRGVRLDAGHGSSTTVPGGDVLVLAGPGGNGDGRRRLRGAEARVGIRWWLDGRAGPVPKVEWERLERARLGREHAEDNHRTDAPSVAQLLSQWEDDWRHLRREPAVTIGGVERVEWWLPGAVGPVPLGQLRMRLRPGGLRATVHTAARYLAQLHTWAAREHDAFAEYHSDLLALHRRLEHATGRAVDVVRANVDCLTCGRALVKELDTAGRTAEDFTCEGCGTVVSDQSYHLALRAELERQNRVTLEGVDYATPQQVAAVLGRPVATVRSWERQGLLRRHDHRGTVLVAVDDATREHQARPTRDRRAS